jgi:PAS domain S-box-containing protein
VDVSETDKQFRNFEETQELFAGFMNFMNTGIFICDNNNICLFRNKYLSGIYDQEVINKLLSEHQYSGLSVCRFVNIKDKENKDRYCELTMFPIHMSGLKKYTGGILVDITSKIECERLKKESETVFKTVFDNSGIGIILTDLEGKIIECNPAFRKLIGYSLLELQKMTTEDITHPIDFEKEKIFFAEAIHSHDNSTLKTEKRFITKDKEIIWTDLTGILVKNDQNTPLYALQLIENITERKLLKEALEHFEQRSNAVIAVIPDLIFIIDEKGTYLDFSAGNHKDLAIDKDKLIGSNIKEVFHPDQFEVILKKINQCIKSGQQETFEYELELNGQINFFEARLERYNDKSVLSIVRNITDIRNKEVQLEKYAEDLEELNASKDRLFSIIAHDLRSPFHALLGLTELLSDDIDSLTKEEVRRIGKELHQAFKNQYRMLENLLAWSRIQKDNIDLNCEVLRLTEAVDDTIHIMQWAAARKKIEIINLVGKDVKIWFDLKMLNSILQNIVSNALKFSDEYSRIKIEYIETNELPAVEITDEGIGLSEEDIIKLLGKNSFSKPGTASELGSGLGLIICREFVEKHGGELYIRSKKGMGTTVGFTFRRK